MDCHRFRDQHALLIDQRCSAVVENEMRAHMDACPRCARLDASVRRSLLLLRNMPEIAPSSDFVERLQARLRAGAQPIEPARSVPFLVFAGLAATLIVATLLALDVRRAAQPPVVQMAPVVATAPQTDPSVLSSALVAALPTGMSVWPAIMAATHAPVHFVSAELADER